MNTPTPLPHSVPLASGQPPRLPDLVQAEHLFRGSQEILIAHNGETYRLRITRSGKLILTK